MSSNKKMIANYFKSVSGKSDIPITEYFSEDIEWNLPPAHPFGGPFLGVPAVLDMMGKAGGLLKMETVSIRVHALIAEQENVVAHFQLTAKTKDEEDYDNEYLFRFLCDGQKIARVWEFLDTHYMDRMGLFEALERSGINGVTV